MEERHCAKCGETFIPRQHNQRFCNSVCGTAWFAEERRRGVELLRNSQTYFGRAMLEGGDSGRYAQVGPVAIGDALPPAAEWLRDPVPDEPPLGYEIDAVPEEARS